MKELPPPSAWQIQKGQKALQEISDMQTAQHITDAIIGLLANEGFWLVVIFLAYRLLRRTVEMLPEAVTKLVQWWAKQ